MKTYRLMSVLSVAMTLSLVSTTVPLQAKQSNGNSNWDKEHPHRAKDLHRISHQHKQLDKDLKDGKISQTEYDRQNKDLHQIHNQERADASLNGGHLTGTEQKQVSGELNSSHAQINKDVSKTDWDKDHPDRAEDLGRISNQQHQLKQDLDSGKISQSQYKSQMQDLSTVHTQEKADAAANGGHLTGTEQNQLSGELNNDHQDIHQDVASQSTWVQNHPTLAKDRGEENTQQQQLDHDLKSGKITQAQYTQQTQDLNTTRQQMWSDAAANNGHLTSGEAGQVNGELKGNGQDIKQDVHQTWTTDHPARAEDLARISNQKNQLNQDLASGKVTQTQYNSQMTELNNIHTQEQSDAYLNGNGHHLNEGERTQVGNELNNSESQIKNDTNNGVTPPAIPTHGQ